MVSAAGTDLGAVVPISAHQDTIGPMCRSVEDLAILLSVIAGQDPLDEFSMQQPEDVPDYTQSLKADGLKGVWLGVPRNMLKQSDPVVLEAFNAALDLIRSLGAEVVDPADLPEWDPDRVRDLEYKVLYADFKASQLSRETVEGPGSQSTRRSTSTSICPGSSRSRRAPRRSQT